MEMPEEPRRSTAPFTLTTPCADCPFRSDVKPYLNEHRVRDLAQAITAGDESFYCHKTVDYDDDGSHVGSRARMCAGALCTLENEDNPNQGMRIAERLGIYDRRNLDPKAPVHQSVAEWVEAQAASR